MTPTLKTTTTTTTASTGAQEESEGNAINTNVMLPSNAVEAAAAAAAANTTTGGTPRPTRRSSSASSSYLSTQKDDGNDDDGGEGDAFVAESNDNENNNDIIINKKASTMDMNLSSSSEDDKDEHVEDNDNVDDDDFAEWAEECYRKERQAAINATAAAAAAAVNTAPASAARLQHAEKAQDEDDLMIEGDYEDMKGRYDQEGQSSSADEEDEESDDNFGEPQQNRSIDQGVAMTFPSDFDASPMNNDEHPDDDDDEELVDWEDVDDLGTTKDLSSLKPVTLDLHARSGRTDEEKNNDKTQKRRSRRRKITYRYESFPLDMRTWMDHFCRTYLVGQVAHAVNVSNYASHPINLHLAFSLVPTPWHGAPPRHGISSSSSSSSSVPTQQDVKHFLSWFEDLMGGRNKTNGSFNKSWGKHVSSTSSTESSSSLEWMHHRLVEYCAHLGSNGRSDPTTKFKKRYFNKKRRREGQEPPSDRVNDDNSFNDYDQLLLFLACCRSLGWRTRYVMAIQPIMRNVRPDSPFLWLLERASGGEASAAELFGTSGKNDDNDEEESTSAATKKIEAASPDKASMSGTAETFQWSKRMKRKLNLAAKVTAVMSVIAAGKKPEDVMVVNQHGDFKDLKIIMVDDLDTKPPAKRAKVDMNEKRMPKSSRGAPIAACNNDGIPASLYSDTNSPRLLCWLEIVCQTPAGSGATEDTEEKKSDSNQSNCAPPSSSLTWIHVDPIRGLANRPDLVEVAFYAHQQRSSFHRSRRRQPIPYALAVEHFESDEGENLVDSKYRVTDVTRRYASSMIESVKARGTNVCTNEWNPVYRRKQQFATMNEWWSSFLRSLNHPGEVLELPTGGVDEKMRNSKLPILSPQDLQKGKTCDDAIELDDGDKKQAAAVAPHTRRSGEDVTAAMPSDDGQFLDIALQHEEEKELQEASMTEALPTSKAGFKKHPLFVIQSVLNSIEVLKPGAKSRAVGFFKGQPVYLRKDVETALSAKKWLYRRRKVKESELPNPILKIKARKKPESRSFKALKNYGVGQNNDGSEAARAQQIEDASQPLDDGKQHLYGSWQTEPWSPIPVGPNDPIPVNEYKNVELDLLNQGLKHVYLHKVAAVARKIQIPYAPCLVGFEGHGGNRRPQVRGIVVHETNEQVLREAHAEVSSHLQQQEEENKRRAILKRWKKLLAGVLTKARLEREYGGEADGE